ncbi:hypothetical protein ACQW02_11930 [Humitalea sp. 24SJ18S-53]|uniref:hypothetical protein n=1 Tax=Humitalea sp. 24SJ18S-53 TaxID=3422307 RepID=UPI003D67CF5D
MRRPFAALAAAVIVGCAQAPETIAPAFVSEIPYLSYTCEQLADEQLRLNGELLVSTQQQQQARSNDTAGVILLGLPLGSMSGGNVAPLIAQYRGQQEAMHRAAIRKGCGQVPSA